MSEILTGTYPGILVRYAGPTNHRGSRYLATLNDGDRYGIIRATESYDHAADVRGNVLAAAWAVRAKLATATRERAAADYAADDSFRAWMMRHADELEDRGAWHAILSDIGTSYVVTFVPAHDVPAGVA